MVACYKGDDGHWRSACHCIGKISEVALASGINGEHTWASLHLFPVRQKRAQHHSLWRFDPLQQIEGSPSIAFVWLAQYIQQGLDGRFPSIDKAAG